MPVRELPRVEYKGKTWFYDELLEQLRNVDDPHDFINKPHMTYIPNTAGSVKITVDAVEDLTEIIEKAKQQYYRPEYAEEVKDEEVLGVMIAHFLEWDSRIFKTVTEALEDANFHTLSEKWENLIGKHE